MKCLHNIIIHLRSDRFGLTRYKGFSLLEIIHGMFVLLPVALRKAAYEDFSTLGEGVVYEACQSNAHFSKSI